MAEYGGRPKIPPYRDASVADGTVKTGLLSQIVYAEGSKYTTLLCYDSAIMVI